MLTDRGLSPAISERRRTRRAAPSKPRPRTHCARHRIQPKSRRRDRSSNLADSTESISIWAFGDEIDEVCSGHAVAAGQGNELADLHADSGTLGCVARDGHAAATPELDHALVSKNSQRSEDRVGIDFQHGGQGPGRRHPFSRSDLTIGDRLAKLVSHLIMQRPVTNTSDPLNQHDAIQSSTIVDVAGTTASDEAVRHDTREVPATAGHLDEQVIIAAARRRQQVRRRRISIVLLGLATVSLLAAGIASNGSIPIPFTNPSGRSGPALKPHPAGTATWFFGEPGNNPLAPAQTGVTCAGGGTPWCYVVIHSYGFGLNGRPTDPGEAPGNSPDTSALLRSTDGGTTWHPLRLPSTTWLSTPPACPTTTTCFIGAAVAGDTIEAYDHPASPVLLATDDGGQTWTQHPLPVDDGMVVALSCSTVNDCAISTLADDYSMPSASATASESHADEFYPTNVIVTTDAGRSWSDVAYPPGSKYVHYQLQSVDCPDTTNCYLSGGRTTFVSYGDGTAGTTGVILHTVDGARALHTSLVSPTVWPGDISCSDSSHCLSMGTNGVDPMIGASTTDAGQIWKQLAPQGLGPAYWVEQLECVTAKVCFRVDLTVSGPNLEVTQDAGAQWTLDPQAGTLDSISCTTASRCLALQQYGTAPVPNLFDQGVRPIILTP